MLRDDIQSATGQAPDLDFVSALGRGEIEPHYQAKVDLRSAHVVGVEALARWNHPEAGLIPAADFLPQVEAGGHMRAFTELMIESSMRAAGDWWRSGLGLQLSVNLPTCIFSEPDWSLEQFVAQALATTGLPGTALQFEITEDALVNEADRVTKAIEQLNALGATVSIDDFGTGHFSFRQLMRLPIEELKIDRSLILDLEDAENRTIVRSIIHLSHQMGLPVVAEGVETEEAWRQLRSMGCERAQGFLIARPLPSREVPAWLAAWNPRARELSSTKRTKRRRITGTPSSSKHPIEATA